MKLPPRSCPRFWSTLCSTGFGAKRFFPGVWEPREMDFSPRTKQRKRELVVGGETRGCLCCCVVYPHVCVLNIKYGECLVNFPLVLSAIDGMDERDISCDLAQQIKTTQKKTKIRATLTRRNQRRLLPRNTEPGRFRMANPSTNSKRGVRVRNDLRGRVRAQMSRRGGC